MNNNSPHQAADIIKKKCSLVPKLGLILGSGLSELANQIQDRHVFPYSELPGFPASSVAGHPGQLIVGTLNELPVACLQGRVHWYEGVESSAMQVLIRTLKVLGCESVLITNASGSLRKDVGPGNLMLITDHINFQGRNPLVGVNDDTFGPRFIAMSDAYDIDLRNRLLSSAKNLGIPLSEGVYISVLGPNFETPAEIRAFRQWGADAVGMSTVPDVIVARHCGLRVALVALITNFAAGMTDEILTHENTLHFAQLATNHLSKLINAFAHSLLARDTV